MGDEWGLFHMLRSSEGLHAGRLHDPFLFQTSNLTACVMSDLKGPGLEAEDFRVPWNYSGKEPGTPRPPRVTG